MERVRTVPSRTKWKSALLCNHSYSLALSQRQRAKKRTLADGDVVFASTPEPAKSVAAVVNDSAAGAERRSIVSVSMTDRQIDSTSIKNSKEVFIVVSNDRMACQGKLYCKCSSSREGYSIHMTIKCKTQFCTYFFKDIITKEPEP